MADLLGWQKEMKQKEAAAKAARAGGNNDGGTLPPVRGSGTPVGPQAETRQQHRKKQSETAASGCGDTQKHPAAHTYDNYCQRWERFDVDAALAEVEQDEADTTSSSRNSAPTTASGSSGGNNLLMPTAQRNTRTASAAPSQQQAPASAETWRERGNEHFRVGNYESALDCYTSAAVADPRCHLALANRAMALLRLRRWAEAEDDCSAALERAPGYVKAWQRRAAARTEQGRWLGAAEDAEMAVRLEPSSKAAAAERQRCLHRLAAAEGLPALASAAPEQRLSVQRLTAPLLTPEVAAVGEGGALLKEVRTSKQPAGTGRGATRHSEQRAVVEAAVQEPMAVDGEEELPPLPGETAAAAPAPAPAVAPAVEAVREAANLQHEAAAPEPVPAEAAPGAACAEQYAAAPAPPTATATAGSSATMAAAAAAAARAAARPAGALRPPRTGVEFERAWRGLRGDAARQAQYLLLLQPSALPAVLRQALTPPLLAAMAGSLLGLLATGGAPSPQREQEQKAAVALLEGLPTVPRFDMNALSLGAGDKAKLREAWEAAAAAQAACGGGGAELAGRLLSLRSAFRL